MKKIASSTTFYALSSTYIGDDVEVKENCTIFPGVYISDNVTIGNNVIIQSGTIIKNNVTIGDNCFIGSCCLIRDNVEVSNNSTIGFNCEIKKTKIGENSLIAHKCFIGDAIIEENVKIGCGTVTANFNRGDYQQTLIKKNTQIGINCSLVAPLTIGENCFIAAASILRHDLEDNKFFKIEYNEVIRENKIQKK